MRVKRNDGELEDPLVPVVDAIAAFLDKPNDSTKGHCTWSQLEYCRATGRKRRTRAREEDGRAAKYGRRLPHRLDDALVRTSVFLFPYIGAYVFSTELIPFSAWGAASLSHIDLFGAKFDGHTTALLAMTANSPQLVISIIYLFSTRPSLRSRWLMDGIASGSTASHCVFLSRQVPKETHISFNFLYDSVFHLVSLVAYCIGPPRKHCLWCVWT